MKVKEAIEQLKQFDPELEILICEDTNEWGTYQLSGKFEICKVYKDHTPMSIDPKEMSYHEIDDDTTIKQLKKSFSAIIMTFKEDNYAKLY
jgi:hypothetical protein